MATLGPYYWEIGDANGVKVSGSVGGTSAPVATTSMNIASSSKWLYASDVLQRHGVLASDVPFLNFTSGYTKVGNVPICDAGGTTVQTCNAMVDIQDPQTVGKYFYASGHMQYHAAAIMGLGNADVTGLANELQANIGNFGFTYSLPQLASGVVGMPTNYGAFLRRLLRNELVMAGALGTYKVCANPATCATAASAPELGANETWNYSLGHWVEDDPTVGDHAFSSAGGAGFYPWINSTKTLYGILARYKTTESDAGYHSAQCGRLVRQAYVTATVVTSPTPTP